MSEYQHNGGIGFVSLLTVLFIGLKLANYINWSWWWILSPVWISIIFLIVVVFFAVLILWLKEKDYGKKK